MFIKILLFLCFLFSANEAAIFTNTDARQNPRLYDILVKDSITADDVIGNVGEILIRNRLVNDTSLVFKYKLIYYAPSIIPSSIVSMSNSKETIFSIEASTGNIKLKIPSNYSTLEYLCQFKRACTCDSCIFNLNVIYSTRNKLNTNVVKVFVDDVNLNAPEFHTKAPSYVVNISEASAIGDRVKLPNAAATDRDAYFNKLTYFLSYSNDTLSPVKEFQIESIDTETKNLNLIINSALDYEKQNRYEYFLIAQDNGLPIPFHSSIGFIINLIDENDNSPVCDESLFHATVREHEQVKNIIRISAKDADSGLNSKIEYRLRNSNYMSEQEQEIDVNTNFYIDHETGWLSVIRPLDFKTQSNYVLTVKAKDMGVKNSYTTYCKVQVTVLDDNDNQARFQIYKYLNESLAQRYYYYTSAAAANSSEILTINIQENNRVDAILAYLRVSDNDTVGNYKFLLSDEKSFSVVKTELNEFNLMASVSFDYEKQTTYLLNLTLLDLPITRDENDTTNKNVYSWSQLIRVNILDMNDNPPDFRQSLYEFYIDENDSNVTLNPKNDIEVYDRDSFNLTNMITYKIIDQSTNIRASQYVSVITDENNIQRPRLVVQRPFDYEVTGSLVEFDLQVADKTNDDLHSRARIRLHVGNVNDNKPVFLNDNRTFHIQRSITPGSYVGRILITDRDKLRNETNFNVSYRIVPSELNKVFRIYRNGIITNLVQLDDEKRNVYELQVKIIDFQKPVSTAMGVYYVQLEDENKDLPAFVYPKENSHYLRFKLPKYLAEEDQRVELFRVKVADPTGVIYSLTDLSNILEIDSLNGVVYVKNDKTTKAVLDVSIEIRNVNGYKNRNNFTLYLNYEDDEIPADILQIMHMDMDEFNVSTNREYDDKDFEYVDEDDGKSSKGSLKSTDANSNANKNKNFFQLVSNSVLIVILLVVLAFMVLIACFILVTAYKRALKTRKDEYTDRSSSTTNGGGGAATPPSNNSSLTSSKLSLTNCMADMKSCLKAAQMSSTTSTPFNGINKVSLFQFYDTNSSRKKNTNADETTLKSNMTTITTLKDNIITVKDAPIDEMDNHLGFSAEDMIQQQQQQQRTSVGSVYNFNTKKISTLQFSANTSNASLSAADELEVMRSSQNENTYNKLYPKLPYQTGQSANLSASFIKNLSMNSDENILQYKEFLNQQAQNIIKKSNSLISKACDMQNQYDNNNVTNTSVIISPYSSLRTPIEETTEELRKYYAQKAMTTPADVMLSSSLHYKPSLYNTDMKNSIILGVNCQIDKHLQNFERIYNEENNYEKRPQQQQQQQSQQPLVYTYTEF